ncbi:hypothetical protein F8388_026650, partial [Cannabis sativa]
MRGSDEVEDTRIHVIVASAATTATTSSTQKSANFMAEKKKSMRARYAYGIIFLIPNLCAWIVRDYGQMIQPQLHYLKSCGSNGRDCVHTLGVLRVSFGYIFLKGTYFSMFVAGELARVGAGIFLLLQLISVIQFINWWNKYWMRDEEQKQSEPSNEKCYKLKAANENGDWTTIVSFLIAICAIVMATFSTGIDSESFQYSPWEPCILQCYSSVGISTIQPE